MSKAVPISTMKDGLAESLGKEFGIGVSSLGHALVALGIIAESEVLLNYRDVEPWRRGGDESYIAVGEATTPHGVVKVLAKALVPFAGTPTAALEVWGQRREVLAQNDVPVPALFGAFKGTIYEQYIEEELPPPSQWTDMIIMQLAGIAAALDYLGFNPLSWLADVRLGGDTVYYVDFGFDLGDPSDLPGCRALETVKILLGAERQELFCRLYNEHRDERERRARGG